MNSKALIATMVSFLFIGASLSGQSVWEDTPLPDMRNPDERMLFPNRMRTLTADLAELDNVLESDPVLVPAWHPETSKELGIARILLSISLWVVTALVLVPM